MAYNFLSGGSAARAGHWTRLRSRLGPDVVLAQECRPPADRKRSSGTTETLVWQPAPARRWGSAVLVRGDRVRPLRVGRYAGWVMAAEIPGPSWASRRPLRVFSIHCPAGTHGYVRTLHAILDRIAQLRGGADLVLGGDFNVVVGHRQPHESIRTTRGERGLLDRLANEFGLMSCWQAAHPGRALAQTLRWSANPVAPYHCDGIFAPRTWETYLVSCRIVSGTRWRQLSDHNPVVAEFRATG